jgi:archaellum component FlaG (FlaF/FlaG flagellin family)
VTNDKQYNDLLIVSQPIQISANDIDPNTMTIVIAGAGHDDITMRSGHNAIILGDEGNGRYQHLF